MKSVWVHFNGKFAFSPVEQAIRRAGERYGKKTGSGYGMGERDISFDVPERSVQAAQVAIRIAAARHDVKVKFTVHEVKNV